GLRLEGQSLEGHGHCVPSASKCLSHQYADQDGECHPCHKYCHRCSGPGKTHCLTCYQKHLLLSESNGTCVDECPAGYFKDELGQKCEACHPSCQSCDSCLSCALGLTYLQKEGRCLLSCPQGYYHDTAHSTCEPCHCGCLYFSLSTLSSVPHQDSGHTCEDCDSSCLECRGPGPANCTMCPVQAILEAGGRCLLCCHHEKEEDESTTQQQDCCNCTKTRGRLYVWQASVKENV
uniref:Growth factor receptor domain-containing protein n=1 Tax=Mastacembelus armatus TaxID=205130 RepID=A0A3Q3MJW6_9TELE